MKHNKGTITFYITNACNLNCDGCGHFNNYSVKGHSRWEDNKESCLAWSKKINPAYVFVLGGEPMVNPDFLLWVDGLATFWPEAEIRILTNGHCFDRWPTLYDVLLKYQGRVTISISGHNEHRKEEEIGFIKKFLRGKIKETKGHEKLFRSWEWKKQYNAIKDPSWPDVTSVEDYYKLPDHIRQEIEEVHKVKIDDYLIYDEPVEYYEVYVDENNIRVAWAQHDKFGNIPLEFDPETQKMTLHESDPDKAVSICHGGGCSHIKDGKYYKCSVVSVLPDLLEQNFPIEMTQEDKDLLLSYEPALPSWDYEKLDKFFQSFIDRDAIPQCKFCPENRTFTKIYAGTKKIKVHKLIKE